MKIARVALFDAKDERHDEVFIDEHGEMLRTILRPLCCLERAVAYGEKCAALLFALEQVP